MGSFLAWRLAARLLWRWNFRSPGRFNAVECPPTLAFLPMVVGLVSPVARRPLWQLRAQTLLSCAKRSSKIGLNKNDIAIGIAASGRTPYVIGGLRYARSFGLQDRKAACNKGSEGQRGGACH